MIERIARTCFRRRRAVVAAWALLLVALTVAGSALAGDHRNGTALPGTESQAASDLLEAGGFAGEAGQAGQVVFATDATAAAGGVEGPEAREAMEGLFAAIEAGVPGVEVVSPYDPDGGARVAPGGDIAYADLRFGTQDYDEGLDLAQDVVDVVDARTAAGFPEGLRVELGGDLFWEPPEAGSEGVGVLAAAVILLVAFGSVLAMGLPLATAIVGLVSGMAVLQVLTRVLDVPDFGPAMLSMIAVGVGIDYALFIVTRYREELAAGREPEGATVRAFGTAGRAVAVAGITVVVSLSGMLLGGVSMIRSLAVAAAVGVVAVLAATLTLLPALLGFCGRNVDRLSVRRRATRARLAAEAAAGADAGRGRWARWARFVQRRPLPVSLAGLALLLVLAAPVTVMRLGFADAGNRADDDTARRAYDLLADGFGDGENGPFVLAADLPGDVAADARALDRVVAAVGADRGIASVGEPVVDEAGEVAVVTAVPTSSPQDEATVDTVHRLRDDVLPAALAGTGAAVHVGGSAAGSIDFSDFQAERLPLFFAAVLLLSFVLLMVVFRSVLVPLKAVIMNLLSIGAAYGVVVAVFQWGWGASLLGVGEPGPVEAWAPMMLFAVVFGLSMDYEVFLLSRIREEYDRTGDNARAVSEGLARTARLITAAAAIMLCVFGGFVLSPERSLQVFGLGLAVAVAVDATVVRLLLVPATMELLGDRNWWLPGWLDRILPRVEVEGAPEPAPARVPEAVGPAR
jgi:RND superfamily putative drug exporter